MIKKVHNCLFTNEDSGNVTIFGGELGILDLAFYEDDPETVIHVIYIDNNIKHPQTKTKVKQKFYVCSIPS